MSPPQPHNDRDLVPTPIPITESELVRTRIITNSNNNSSNWPSLRRPYQRQQPPSVPHQTHSTGTISKKGVAQEGILFGSGTSHGLCAARRRQPHNGQSGNRTITGLFVTNLEPRTTTKQIEVYVKRESGYKVTAEKLRTKFDSYSSFYIPCDQTTRRQLMDPFLWPAESKIKPFYS